MPLLRMASEEYWYEEIHVIMLKTNKTGLTDCLILLRIRGEVHKSNPKSKYLHCLYVYGHISPSITIVFLVWSFCLPICFFGLGSQVAHSFVPRSLPHAEHILNPMCYIWTPEKRVF